LASCIVDNPPPFFFELLLFKNPIWELLCGEQRYRHSRDTIEFFFLSYFTLGN